MGSYFTRYALRVILRICGKWYLRSNGFWRLSWAVIFRENYRKEYSKRRQNLAWSVRAHDISWPTVSFSKLFETESFKKAAFKQYSLLNACLYIQPDEVFETFVDIKSDLSLDIDTYSSLVEKSQWSLCNHVNNNII